MRKFVFELPQAPWPNPQQGGICVEQNRSAFVGDGLDPVGSYEIFYFLMAPCSTSWLGLAWLTGVHCLTPLVLLLGSAWPGFLVCLSEPKLGWLDLARLRVWGLDPFRSYEIFYFLMASCSTSWLGSAWLFGVLVCTKVKVAWLGLAWLKVWGLDPLGSYDIFCFSTASRKA
jgi:hypothetical protein